MHPLDAMGHRWVGALASFEFSLEYQKGAGNGAANALSRVPVNHDCTTIQSLLEGTVIGAWTKVQWRPMRLCCASMYA